MRLAWFDTADGALGAQGRIIEISAGRQGTRQVLRQVLPEDDQAWLPGAPGAVLAETRLSRATPDAGAAGLAEGTPLVALATAEGRTRQLETALDGAPATLAIADGTLCTPAAEQRFARVLITAPPDTLFAIGLRLAGEVPLLPAFPLAEAARALALGQPARPPGRNPPAITREMRVEESLVHVVLQLAGGLLWLVPTLGDRDSVEAVHQTRVTLRRLRSALAVWRAAIDSDALRGLGTGLRDMARLLGPVRDRDVLLGGMLAALESDLAAEGTATAPGLAEVRDALATERAAAHCALLAWTGSAAFRQLVLGLLAETLRRGWRAEADREHLALLDAPVAGFAAHVLHRRSRKLLKRGDGLADAPIAALHAMRLSAKRLRYAGEFFAPLFAPRTAKRYLRRLAALQDALGIVNDGAVAGSLVQALPAAAGEAAGGAAGGAAGERAWAEGALHGYAAARATMARRDAAAAWRKLRKTAPFWTG